MDDDLKDFETKLSESAAKSAKQISEIIGTMMFTRAFYEHDGVDTTAIDRNIEQLTDHLKRTVALQRSYKEREDGSITK